MIAYAMIAVGLALGLAGFCLSQAPVDHPQFVAAWRWCFRLSGLMVGLAVALAVIL